MGLYFRLYPLIIIVQVFCLYHAYRNKADQKWFWFIIVFPLVGAIFYLYHHFYSRENVAQITESAKNVINTNYETKKLEKQLNFSDSVLNKTNLANKYIQLGRNEEAIELLESCRDQLNENNPEILQSLIPPYFIEKNYEKVIDYGNIIKEKAEFKDSQEHIMFAWSYYYIDQNEKAENEFKKMDGLFCNYTNRLDYARFMNQIGKKEDAKMKVEELLNEIGQMSSHEKRTKRGIFNSIKIFYKNIQ